MRNGYQRLLGSKLKVVFGIRTCNGSDRVVSQEHHMDSNEDLVVSLPVLMPNLILKVTVRYHTHMKETIITAAPDVMGGTPVFTGTRVPVQTLTDYLKGGESIDDFLEGFPSVSREQVVAFLEEAEEQIVKLGSVR